MAEQLQKLLLEAAEALDNLTNFADQAKWDDLVKRLRIAAKENAPLLTPSLEQKNPLRGKYESRLNQGQGR